MTEILPSRKASPLIPAIQLEEFAFRAQQVYISSEMVKMLRDIVTGLRNDRRLRKGVSAQLALELVPICQ